MSIFKTLNCITSIYIGVLIIYLVYNIYWIIIKLIDISNFELSIDLYLCIFPWLFFVITVYNVILYIFSFVFGNFQTKWFYIIVIFNFIILLCLMFNCEKFTVKYNLTNIIRKHYSVTNTTTNLVYWKNFSYKMFCMRSKSSEIFDQFTEPKECIEHIASFLLNIYTQLFHHIVILCIASCPLLFVIIIFLIIHYKLLLAYKISSTIEI